MLTPQMGATQLLSRTLHGDVSPLELLLSLPPRQIALWRISILSRYDKLIIGQK
jgi:hypothetical protein